MIQPFALAAATLDWYRRYVRASFPFADPSLEADRERLIEGGLLWAPPFVALGRPGKPGPLLSELAGSVLGKRVLEANWGFDRLYDQQARAIARLARSPGHDPEPTLVLSGTGSGKTESFLIPIVDACLSDPRPGVRAVLLYPMNALANDQLKRLTVLLAHVPEVSFGRYTGDAPEIDAGDARRPGRPEGAPANLRWSREAMQEDPPSILLTNYTMLEYLLLRGEDQRLFAAGSPDYLVVDEIHLFSGILGAEVAALLRRFRAHVGGGNNLCVVGTSATAGSEAERDDLADFARRFFGVGFGPDGLVTEEPVPPAAMGPLIPPPPMITPELLAGTASAEGIAALAQAVLGVDLPVAGVAERLGAVIDRYGTVALVEQALADPAPIRAAAEALGRLPERAGICVEDLAAEAQALLLLGAAARVTAIGEEAAEPRFRPRVHQVLRSLAGLWRCTDPAHGPLLAPEALRCDCGALSLPTASCRTCGEAFWHVRASGTKGLLAQVDPDRDDDVLVLGDPARLGALVDTDEDGEELSWKAVLLCPSCGAITPEGSEIEHARSCRETGRPLARLLASSDLVHCPACGSKGASNRPIILPLRGSAAASVAVVTKGLSDLLRASTDEAGGRLLVFSDSRQDAAQQAGYADDQGGRIAVRQLVSAALERGDGAMSLPALLGDAHRLVDEDEGAFRRFLLGSVERSFAELSAPGYQPSGADRSLVDLQLDWEIVLELTERARRRFSLEQEGVVVVTLEPVEGLAQAMARDRRLEGLSPARLAEVLAAFADVCRYYRAVDHWLLLRSPRDLVRNHHLRLGDRSVASTRGFATNAYESRRAGVDIRAWTRPKNATRLSELLRRILGSTLAEANEAVEALVLQATDTGLLAQHKADGRSRYLLDHNRLLIKARETEELYRCDRCGTVRATGLHGPNGESLCLNWRCPGVPRHFEPSASRSFYRDQYRSVPRRFVVREHSAQVESDVRLALEERFNDRERPLIDALACTPTLEVGVSLDDLHAVVLRNLPPSPANYAQRVGRAGRRSKVALAVAHAGHRPHDSYFFAQPGELISGAVSAPAISLDNAPVLARHINSLILSGLGVELPRQWVPSIDGQRPDEPTIADPDGVLREDALRPFVEALGDPALRARIEKTGRSAFASPEDPAPPAGIEALLARQLGEFPVNLRRALNRWCDRYRALVGEWKASVLGAGIPSPARKQYQDRLYRELERLARPATPEYRPIGFLGLVGFLPRYGFTGEAVLLHAAGSDEPMTQSAVVAIATFAPGNVVYARGRRLKVQRVQPVPVPEASAGPEHRDNVLVEGRRCDRCEIYSTDPLQKACPTCQDDLVGQRSLALTSVAAAGGTISADDEVRRHSYYDIGYFLGPIDPGAPASHEVTIGAYVFKLTRQRKVTVANRGRRQREGTSLGFNVCTRCGFAEEAAPPTRKDDDPEEEATGHGPTCPARSSPSSEVVSRNIWLTADFQGDVAELLMPSGVRQADQASFRVTLAEALVLGIRETMRAGDRDIGWFERLEAGVPVSLVFYDSMPGGTGYLPKLFADDLAGLRAALELAIERLEGCSCTGSCHRCLRDFWNQRYHGMLDRFAALGALRRLAGLDPSVGIEPDDARLESFLEEEFFGRLQAAGLPLPTLQVVRVVGERRIIRVDAEYRKPDVSIFLDGRAYHATDPTKILDDLDARNRLEAQGVCVLELTYADVLDHFDVVADQMRSALNPAEVPVVTPETVAGLTMVQVDSIGRRVLAEVDVESWVANESARQHSLAAANRLRLAGWRLERRGV